MTSTLRAIPFLIACGIVFSISGCSIPRLSPNYAYGNPAVLILPVYIPSYGYGYWHDGHFWKYRKGYSFYNGHYYSAAGLRGGGYGGNRGYGGDAGWNPKEGGYGN